MEKIFGQMTRALVLPLSFFYQVVLIQITVRLFTKIVNDEYTMTVTLKITPEGTSSLDKSSLILSSEWTTFLLFMIGYFIFFLVLALLSTSAVVYTIACSYTAKEITFKKVMSVVPMVWKRLMVTFIWNFVFVFAFNFMALLILILGVGLLGPIKIVGTIFVISFFIGFLYINMIWQLGSVVSVLEEIYGLNAMAKSQALIKGKVGVSAAVFLLLGLCYYGVQMVFWNFALIAYEKGLGYRIGWGIVCLTLMWMGKNHLGGYLREYVPLKFKDVQLESHKI